MAAEARIIATVIDPAGRRVVLDNRAWVHICDEHPEMRVRQKVLLQAVERPSLRVPGRRSGEEWVYLEGVGPSRAIKVVVLYSEGSGRIRTAFPRRAVP